MHHASTISLNPKAYRRNLRFIRHRLAPASRFCAVVKGNAYGHGIEQFIPIAEEAAVDYFAVYNAHEAYRVWMTAKQKPSIMVMGFIDDADLDWAIDHEIECFVFTVNRLISAAEKAKKIGKKALIHLEIETGMNRTGFDIEQLPDIIPVLQKYADSLTIMGVCTHFAGAESIGNFVRIQRQKERFAQACRLLTAHHIQPKYKHVNCSAGIIRYPEMNYDLVRIGILQYGFWPSMETFIEYSQPLSSKDNPLQRMLTWKSKVMNTKHIAKGEYVGYGSTYLAQKPMTIAIVPIGYAHGYSRSLSNQGRVLVQGRRCAVIGIVNMNAIAIDVSPCKNVQPDDEVVLIGRQGKHTVSVASFGELSNQLNYELLTRLPLDIPRHVDN